MPLIPYRELRRNLPNQFIPLGGYLNHRYVLNNLFDGGLLCLMDLSFFEHLRNDSSRCSRHLFMILIKL